MGGVWPGATLLLLLSNILPLLLLAPYTQAGPDGEDSAFDKVFPPFIQGFGCINVLFDIFFREKKIIIFNKFSRKQE